MVVGYVAVVATQFVPLALRIVPVPVAVEGNVAVVHEGAPDAPDCKCCPAVTVPERIAIAVAVE